MATMVVALDRNLFLAYYSSIFEVWLRQLFIDPVYHGLMVFNKERQRKRCFSANWPLICREQQ